MFEAVVAPSVSGCWLLPFDFYVVFACCVLPCSALWLPFVRCCCLLPGPMRALGTVAFVPSSLDNHVPARRWAMPTDPSFQLYSRREMCPWQGCCGGDTLC